MIQHAMARIRALEDRFDQLDARLERIEALLTRLAGDAVSSETPRKKRARRKTSDARVP